MFEPPERHKKNQVDKRESDQKKTSNSNSNGKKVLNKLIESKPTSVTSVYWI